MKAKALGTLLPIVAIAVMVCLYLASQWQQSQARRPGYDDPTAAPPAPGLLAKPEGETATVINVDDGDSITVKWGLQSIKVRLCGIAAPALGQSLGLESRDYLRQLIASTGNQVVLYGSDTDRYGRKVAEVFIPDPTPQQPEQEKVLNEAMVRAGMAYHYAQYSDRCPNGSSSLVKAETQAQSKRIGVWAKVDQKPWEYRQQR